MFLHGGWLHLIVNMWTLWLFGRVVEDQLGSGRYLAFYFACGVLASATYAALNPTSTVPALGASGAIAGVLGCYMRLFPFSRIVVLVPILFLPLFFEVPAIVFAGLWFLIQAFEAMAEWFTPFAGGVIAWWAHIGGFIAGVILAGLLRPPPAPGLAPRCRSKAFPASPSPGLSEANNYNQEDLMTVLDIFWIFFMLSALQPVIRQRMLDAMRMRKIAQLERERNSRVILLVHRQETMKLLGFPVMRYIDVNDFGRGAARDPNDRR